MLKATIFLLICGVAIGTAGGACREQRPATAEAPPPVMTPAAAQAAPKPVPVPEKKRHAAPPRRCSMLAYLVV